MRKTKTILKLVRIINTRKKNNDKTRRKFYVHWYLCDEEIPTKWGEKTEKIKRKTIYRKEIKKYTTIKLKYCTKFDYACEYSLRWVIAFGQKYPNVWKLRLRNLKRKILEISLHYSTGIGNEKQIAYR